MLLVYCTVSRKGQLACGYIPQYSVLLNGWAKQGLQGWSACESHSSSAAHPECSSPASLQPTQALPRYTTPPHRLLVAAQIWFKSRVLAYRAVNVSGTPYTHDMVEPYSPACLPRSTMGLILPHRQLRL